jgi:hypothetical protein
LGLKTSSDRKWGQKGGKPTTLERKGGFRKRGIKEVRLEKKHSDQQKRRTMTKHVK